MREPSPAQITVAPGRCSHGSGSAVLFGIPRNLHSISLPISSRVAFAASSATVCRSEHLSAVCQPSGKGTPRSEALPQRTCTKAFSSYPLAQTRHSYTMVQRLVVRSFISQAPSSLTTPWELHDRCSHGGPPNSAITARARSTTATPNCWTRSRVKAPLGGSPLEHPRAAVLWLEAATDTDIRVIRRVCVHMPCLSDARSRPHHGCAQRTDQCLAQC